MGENSPGSFRKQFEAVFRTILWLNRPWPFPSTEPLEQKENEGNSRYGDKQKPLTPDELADGLDH
jgi:hypothetical protein